MDAITITANVDPRDIENDNRSIYIWLDLLGFSDFVNDGTKYRELADHLKKFQSIFMESDNYITNIISDGIILRITKPKRILQSEFTSILKEVAEKQFRFIKENRVFIRGGIAVGTKLEDSDDSNNLYISNGLAKAVKIEGSFVNWPVIGTKREVIDDIKDLLDIHEETTFGMKKAFNMRGEELYFIDFITPDKDYYQLLNIKMDEHKDSASIRNKYLWLMRYYHHSCDDAYTLDAVYEKVVL